MHIGRAIRLIRIGAGIFTQKELAAKCKLSQTTLSQIETGLKTPSVDTLKKICAIVDIPEHLLYLLAIEEKDISANKRAAYRQVFPFITALLVQYVDTKELQKKGNVVLYGQHELLKNEKGAA